MSREADAAPRRIVVALDASPASLSALAAGVELASRVRAEVFGVFVEDLNLVRLGRLAFAPHVGLPSGERGELDEAWVEAQLRSLAGRARDALREALEKTRVPGQLRVVRGSVTREVLAAADAGDLLILGCASRPLTSRPRLGRTARAAVEQAAGPVLLLPEGARLGRPVLVVYDAAGEEALDAAIRLAERALLVLASGASAEEAARRGRDAAAKLAERGLASRVRAVPDDDVARALRSERKGLVVVGLASPLLRASGLAALLEDATPVLVARRAAA